MNAKSEITYLPAFYIPYFFVNVFYVKHRVTVFLSKEGRSLGITLLDQKCGHSFGKGLFISCATKILLLKEEKFKMYCSQRVYGLCALGDVQDDSPHLDVKLRLNKTC